MIPTSRIKDIEDLADVEALEYLEEFWIFGFSIFRSRRHR